MSKNRPLPEGQESPYDPLQWTRIEFDSIPVYVNRDHPDWFVPNLAGDQLLSSLAAGESYPRDLHQQLFLHRLPVYEETDLARLPASLSTHHLRECWLHITNNCNQACRHCLFACSPGEKESLSLQQIISLTDQAASLGCRVFALTGGEPLVHPQFSLVIDHLLANKDHHVAVLTNGMLWHRFEKELQYWPKNNLHLQISIDGLEEEHDRLRGEGSFKKLRHELNFLRQQNMPFTLSMCVTKSNVNLMPNIIELAADVGAANVHFMWYFIHGRGQSDAFISPQKIFMQLQAAAKKGAELGIGIDNLEAMRTQVFAPPGTIHWAGSSGWESITIGPDRKIYPSPALAGMKELGAEINSDLKTTWRSDPVFKNLRQANAMAINHPLRFILGGGDPDHSYIHAGKFSGHDPYWPLYEAIALWQITREATTQPDHGQPKLRLKMGDILESCGSHGRETLVHNNCLLSLTQLDSRTVIRKFYGTAATKPNLDILNPVNYPDELLAHIPTASRVRSYGCGSPIMDADLQVGEKLVDLGSGSGVECFIGARLVGKSGQVTGVDMLDPMLALARQGAVSIRKNLGYDNLSFKKGFLESLPLPDQEADVIISNCVLNLSTNKRRTFAEILRVLRPGGRLVVADVVCEDEPDPAIRSDDILRGECIAGALTQKNLFALLHETGFINPKIIKRFPYRIVAGHPFYSLTFAAWKPGPGNLVKMIYRGPFAAVLTADQQLLTPGRTYTLPSSQLEGCGEEVFLLDNHGLVSNIEIGDSCCVLPPEVGEKDAETRESDDAGEKKTIDCMICGAPLVYQQKEEEKSCTFCHQTLMTNAFCEAGHFVCDECHAKDALKIIEHMCTTTSETDMIALLQQIRNHPRIPVHGPEHHALVPGIILATYKNLGGEISSETIKSGISRGARVPGGFCGFFGACGAALGVGIAFGLILQSTPMKAAARQQSQSATQSCLADIAKLDAARCCQRDSWLALNKAAELSQTMLPISLQANISLHCKQRGINPTCIGSKCPIFPPSASPQPCFIME
ncbi:MAG TPA: methyltransferase domain-containing protein [Desulfarculaceae bacterium]|nr:methyltransferase domain-containing protein [Desulfarculaceae bacterium]